MPRSPAKALTSTVASPADTEIPTSHFRQGQAALPRSDTSSHAFGGCSAAARVPGASRPRTAPLS
jgi:hypothetical protein